MRNRLRAIVGVVLILAGAISLFYRGIPYKSREVVVDRGSVTATAATNTPKPECSIRIDGRTAGRDSIFQAGESCNERRSV
ncbi:MAG TPA: hypothetical protein PLY87_26960 [Planctomycetaceae bacterium]|nr:hypothetical protein [Planctomycetaceae bacterium]